ncbi:MAG: S41 family peptidase [Longimonas sp.]|uniref:S41 family peptidase n=1 Tax=Longimonas sp. TaxID=2039626 RepID=UPI003976F6D0
MLSWIRLALYSLLAFGIVATAHAQDNAADDAEDTTRAPLVRHPAVHPDGETIAFSFQGDVWSVPVSGGRANRLTVHEAYESNPTWSPDGNHLAFSSDRYGGDDLYVMDAEGSRPNRRTFYSGTDALSQWAPTGDLLFTTRRAYAQVERESEIHRVDAEGGLPQRHLDALGYAPVMSPDERFIVFERGSNGTTRKRYRGPAAKQLWLYDTEDESYTQLTTFDGNDHNAVWTGPRTLHFISERSETYNVHRLTLADDGTPEGDPEAVTTYDNGNGVRHLSAGADGAVLAFERHTDIYVMRPEDEADPERLSVQVAEDDRFDPVERETMTRSASDMAVSPNEDYIAFAVRGRLFLTRNDDESNHTVQLTTEAAHDREVQWLDDETLLFVSDRGGTYDLYRLESGDAETDDLFDALAYDITPLTETETDERSPVLAPDRSQVAFHRGAAHYGPKSLVVADLTDDQTLNNERVLHEGWNEASGVAWSPDGQWLAYSRPDLDYNHEVYIHAADGSEDPVNVTQHPRPDRNPVWSPDGSKLGFVSGRSGGNDDIWFVWLRESDWEKTQQDWDEDAPQRPSASNKEANDEANDEEEGEDDTPDPVEIDFDTIHERLERVTAGPANEANPVIGKEGDTFFYVAGRGGRTTTADTEVDLYSIQWDGSERKALTEGDLGPYSVRLGPEQSHLFFAHSSGQLARIATDGGSVERLPFRARMEIDYPAERAQVFDEMERAMEQGFYDPNFHDADWDALVEQYRPWAMRASTSTDFQYMVNLMLGELNASHMGFYGPDRADTQSEQTGLLGVEWAPADNGLEVTRVVPDSPADREVSRLNVGDVVTSIDGTALSASTSPYRLLNDTVDELVMLTVQDDDGDTRTVRIRPTSSLRSELYQEWVDTRDELAREYSDGRLGYLHVQGMNWPSFERFERELFASGNGKGGLIIDVRYNGGGWTTDYLMATLNVNQHAYTIPRGATDNLEANHTEFRDHYPFGERLPYPAWTKPAGTLINQNSYSNAEIFAHAFKSIDRGPVVGTPTFGAVISTGGVGLLNGSFVRMPFRAWYVRETDQNMEHGPATPTTTVSNPPDARAQGEDPQLERMVNELLQRVDNETSEN